MAQVHPLSADDSAVTAAADATAATDAARRARRRVSHPELRFADACWHIWIGLLAGRDTRTDRTGNERERPAPPSMQADSPARPRGPSND